MKKRILISMYSMNIGGAERSLIGLLESFDYESYDIDLFLYRHEGEFLSFIPKQVNLLQPIKQYTTFERPIKDVIKEGHIYLGSARILAKIKANLKNTGLKKEQRTYKQMQYTWHYSMPALPKLNVHYDIAISFLGPHNFILEKVEAKMKLGWSHTDYFTIVHPDKPLDEKMWTQLDYIVNVSKDCHTSFLKVFPDLEYKSIVLENIISSTFVKRQSNEDVGDAIPEDDSIKICSVGRFSNQKGFDLAVKACKQIVQEGFDVKWFVVGYGGEEQYIKELIRENKLEDKFILLGKKVNPYPYIKKCDIYCQPSRYEGKAVTVREAQILGKPVLITNYPTANSQLEHGIDGYVCDLSVEGIVDGLKTLCQDVNLRESLAGNCLQRDYSNGSEINKLYQFVNS
ncbi:glycosyltransferase [Bacillus suaedae]|uniref:Glycosyltransferase n=1 Tax=Halalkalibacter suaedae TaxID=2822140 RepID=A0A940WS72_9BACI|nr:glycosyltransferase [Bacillus suaedae]MBP3951515.1 glycosyltransferase [Bacillus suaedae]